MSLLVETLQSNGYVVLDELSHKEIVPFVQKWLKKPTLSTILFIVANVAIVVLIAVAMVRSPLNVADALGKLGLGVILAFLLVPLHEFIHGIAYRIVGAKRVSYGANIRRFVFYAMADKFVVTAKQFRFIAIAPFAVISAVLLAIMPFAGDNLLLVLLGMLFMHTGACSGDFGLMSYLDHHKQKTVVTYDDEAAGMSYFLVRAIKN